MQPQMHQNTNTTINPNQRRKTSFLENFFSTNRNIKIGGILFSAIIIILIIILIISSSMQPKPVQQEAVTITFWTRDINQEAIRQIISDFESQNTLIKVKHEIQSETDYKNRIVTRLSGLSTNMGNIVEIDESWIEELIPTLSPISDNAILGRYSAATLNNNSFNNNIYAVPYAFDGILLAYNKDHLSEIAFTEEDFNKLDWSGLATKAKSITKTQKAVLPTQTNKQYDKIIRSGIAVGSPRTVNNAKQILKLLILQNETNIYSAEKKQYVIDTKFTEVMNFYVNFTVQNIWNDSIGNDIKAFAEGKTSMVLVRSSDIDKIMELNPNLNFATTIPAKIASIRNISLSKSLIIPSYMPNYAQSVKFLEFLTRSDNSIKIYEAKNTSTFVPAQITTLNKIPRTSPFAAFSDINPTADRIKTFNEDSFDIAIESYLTETFDSYYKTAIPGENTAFKFDIKKLESTLNATTRKTK